MNDAKPDSIANSSDRSSSDTPEQRADKAREMLHLQIANAIVLIEGHCSPQGMAHELSRRDYSGLIIRLEHIHDLSFKAFKIAAMLDAVSTFESNYQRRIEIARQATKALQERDTKSSSASNDSSQD